MNDLPTETLNGVKLLQKLDPSQIKTLVDLTFQILSKEKTDQVLLEDKTLKKLEPQQLKQLHSALTSFILHAAKANTDVLELEQILESLPKDKLSIFTTAYKNKLPELRNRLSGLTFAFPHITDVRWRLDYMVKSDTLERANSAVYFIRLKTIANEGKVEHVEFSCTLEQLEDLVTKLEDAGQSLERVRDKIL
eukprot:TRINITY_DN9242_c1_g1_i1.p1 TRINITY_DN9242_c1_g1~~TRINITY_DN9242_c1_g1_i1.p1  ORF type:complete len:193 (-),score=39.41 TRINITY_DN9242_c1_g1_i1:123-701(-)